MKKENEKEYYRKEFAYFSNNKYSLELLGIFKIIFDNNLLFQLGYSVTNGRYGTFCRNSFFLKKISGGETKYAYPKHGYLNRIKCSACLFYILYIKYNNIINNKKKGNIVYKII